MVEHMVFNPTREARIFVDFTALNRHVLRKWHSIPTVEHTLGLPHDAKVFSKPDASSGLWQIPLGGTSKELTTFISLFGKCFFNKPPSGISSAPEQFQRQMSSLLRGINTVVCPMDDILIWDSTEDHNETLLAVLQSSPL